MNAFVGRTDLLGMLAGELASVQSPDAKPGRMLALRGRRQVGKSTLVDEFIRQSGMPAVFYVASRQTADRELEQFASAISESPLDAAEIASSVPLGSWEAALALIASEATPERPLIIVFDELPYLIESNPSIEGILQKVWDRTLEKANVLVLLVGSDISMMEALAEYGRPLYGRLREVVVPPLSPAAVAGMLGLESAPALDAFLVIGGFPRLAALWKPGEGMWEFLERELADPTTPLAVIGERTVTAEFPADLQARQVLEAIGSGERAYTAIAQRSGVSQTSLNRALETLQAKGVALKAAPYSNKKNPKHVRYFVADAYLRFWLRFINPNLELIQRGRGEVALERIREAWSTYRGRAIEPIVRDALMRTFPAEQFGGARFVGGYWTRDNRVEVDLVGGREESNSDMIDFVGSIKWKEESPFDRADFAALAAHREHVPGATSSTLLVGVSRSGFSVGGLDARVGPDDLINAWRA